MGSDGPRFMGGVRNLDGTSNRTDIPCDFKDEFMIGVFVRDGFKNAGKVYIVDKEGKETVTLAPITVNMDHGPLKTLRVGAVSEFPAIEIADYFRGDLACMLVYNRALSHDERLAVTGQLSKRYFGK
jgi:hypothetical protein